MAPLAVVEQPLANSQVSGKVSVSVFPEPVTLSSVTVLDPAGKELMRIDGGALAAATQTLFAKTPSPVVPASAAVSVDVDLILPPGAALRRHSAGTEMRRGPAARWVTTW